MAAAAPSSSFSSTEEQKLHDSLHSFLKQQATVLLQQLLAFDNLASRNEKGSDSSFPCAEESSSLHFVGRFLMLQIDLFHRQIQMFETIEEYRAARMKHVSHGNELSSLFSVVNTYGHIASKAMLEASSIPSEVPLPPSDPLLRSLSLPSKHELMIAAMKPLIIGISYLKEPMEYTMKCMNEWEKFQDADVPKLLCAYTWWKNKQTAGPSSLSAIEGVHAPSTSSARTSKPVYTLGPLEGENCGYKAQCSMKGENVEVWFSRESSHSYVSRSTAKRLKIAVSEGREVRVKVANGRPLKAKEYAMRCRIVANERILIADLIVLPFSGCDVVLGNNWLTSCEYHFYTSSGITLIRGGVEINIHHPSS